MSRLATDVGGTFTDLVRFDETTGALTVAKALTTPADPSQGVMDAIGLAEVDLAGIGFFIHGGTTVINAITERKGARTALVTTRGFRDVLEIGRGNRPDLYNLQFLSPTAFVPRHLRFEVMERVSAKGEVVEPLRLEELDAIANDCREAGVEAIAVVFLHSYLHPAHEAACRDRLSALLPDAKITASHDITREWREYERSNTAVLNAYVQPIIERYFDRLDQELATAGLSCGRYAMQSNGGSASFASARNHPITLIESGPAAGIAGAALIGQTCGPADLLFLDIGGTTAKTAILHGGVTPVTTEYKLERSRTNPGYPVRVSVLDLVEIGAGGGSIAWFDKGGALRVGPESAGADPGPACYGRGGTAATLTDANLIAGRIADRGFAGGLLDLSEARARQAFEPVAARLGSSLEEAAMAVIALAEAAMIDALKLVSIQRGHDPRDFALLACGGGGPLHGPSLGAELDVKEIIVPPHPGIFSAWGMLASAPRRDFIRTKLMRAEATSAETIEAHFAGLDAEAAAYFAEFDGATADKFSRQRAIDMRYFGQEHSVAVPVSPGDGMAQILETFHRTHRRAYSFALDDTPVELVSFRLHAEAQVARPRLAKLAQAGDGGAETGRRSVLFAEFGLQETPVFDRADLPAGFGANGPAIIEEPTSTTLVRPDQCFALDDWGNIRIRRV